MSLEIKTQLEEAKESLKYMQKKVEGELAVKLMGRESLIEDFELHIRESKVSFRDVLEKIAHLTAWKETFDSFYAKSVDDLRRRIGDCISKNDLSKYNEEQTELFELKLQTNKEEIRNINNKVLEIDSSKEDVMHLSMEMTKLKKRLELMEAKMGDGKRIKKNEDKISDLEKLIENKNENVKLDIEKVNEEMNSKLETLESEIKRLKSDCDKLKNNNNELNSKLVREINARSMNNDRENLISELKESINNMSESQNSIVQRVEDIENLKVNLEKKISMVENKTNNKEINDLIKSLQNDVIMLKEEMSNKLKMISDSPKPVSENFKDFVALKINEALSANSTNILKKEEVVKPKNNTKVETVNDPVVSTHKEDLKNDENLKESLVDDLLNEIDETKEATKSKLPENKEKPVVNNSIESPIKITKTDPSNKENEDNPKDKKMEDFLERLPDANDFQAHTSDANQDESIKIELSPTNVEIKNEKAEDFGNDDVLDLINDYDKSPEKPVKTNIKDILKGTGGKSNSGKKETAKKNEDAPGEFEDEWLV